MPGVVLINPAGEEEFVGTSRVEQALADGYTARSGDTTALRNPSGSERVVATEDVDQALAPGVGTVDAGSRLADVQAGWDDEQYGGFTGGVAALGLGAARGLTFGLSDLAVDPEAATGYARENPGLDLLGQVAGGVAAGGVTGLSRGATSLGASLAPGSKAAAALIAGVAEGVPMGAGIATSNLILKNEPLTAESIFTEYGSQIFLGGAFGGVGGVVGHGLGSVGGKLISSSERKLGEAAERELLGGTLGPSPGGEQAAEAVTRALGDLDKVFHKAGADLEASAATRQWFQAPEYAKPAKAVLDFDSELASTHAQVTEQLAKRAEALGNVTPAGAAPALPDLDATQVERLIKLHAEAPVPSETLIRSYRLTKQWADDTLPHIVELGKGEAKADVANIKKLYGELNPYFENGADKLGRPRLASGGGNKATKALSLEERRGLASKLVEYRNAARELEAKYGGPGLGIGEPADEVLALERFAARQNPYIGQADDLYEAARASDPDAIRELLNSGKLHPDAAKGIGLDELEKTRKGIEQALKSWDSKLAANEGQLAQAAKLKQLADDLGPHAALGEEGLTKLGSATMSGANEVAGTWSEQTSKLLSAAEALGDKKLIERVTKLAGRVDDLGETVRGFAGKAKNIPALPELVALNAAREARLAVTTQLGDEITVAGLAQLPREKAVPVLSALNDYYKAVRVLGNTSDEFARATKAVERSLKQAVRGAGSVSGVNMLAGLGAYEALQAVPDFEGPIDDLAKLWIAARVARGRQAEFGSAGSSSWLQRTVKSAARHSGYRVGAAGGGRIMGGIRGAVASSAAASLAERIMGGTAGLAKTTSRAVAHAEQTIGKLLEHAGTGVRRAAPFAPKAFLESVKFADLDHPEGRTAFEKRAAELRANTAARYGVQKAVMRNLGELVETHPRVADKVIAHADRVQQFLASKLPKDPGTVSRLGESAWKASEQDIAKFARSARAALDPDGEMDRFASMELSPEGAEALRVLYPAKFAELQRQVAANLPALRKKLRYEQQNQLSVLLGVPVNSMMEPARVRASQATFAADATAQPVSQPPAGVSSTPLSPAQQLLTR